MSGGDGEHHTPPRRHGTRQRRHDIEMNKPDLSPVRPSQRLVWLDALRGFALLGICLANFPEFSLYTFLKPEAAGAMPSAAEDSVARFLLYVFIDGKFYTLFSLLFGIGFSIIITNAKRRGGSGLGLFYRRMGVLAAVGAMHLMFIWSGDILLLYALLGMLLPLFSRVSDRGLLVWAVALLVLPVLVDTACQWTGVQLSRPVIEWQQACCARYGITDDNFAYWLRDADGYGEVFQFLLQGALVRAQEFIEGNRYFKVLGLFLIGLYIGRHKIAADIAAHRDWLVRVCRAGLAIGLPFSFAYSWSAMHGRPMGEAVHSALYLVSIYPLGFAYASGLCLLWLRHDKAQVWGWLAAPGRMALTSYIGQSVIGVLIFYGIGLGIGASVGLVQTEVIALATYLVQMLSCRLWLARFQFGPLEWMWRMLTYGKKFPITKRK